MHYLYYYKGYDNATYQGICVKKKFCLALAPILTQSPLRLDFGSFGTLNHEAEHSFFIESKSLPLVVDRLLSYVSDLEKITILMHSLARRLATTELKLSKKQGQSQQKSHTE